MSALPSLPRRSPAGPLIASISEPSLCRYALAVCIPELCVDSPAPVMAVAKVEHASQLRTQEAPQSQAPVVPGKPAVSLQAGGGESPVQVTPIGDTPAPRAVADRATAEASTTGQLAAQKGMQQHPDGGRARDIGLPESFILAFWRALLGDSSADFASLLSGEPSTGISPVRFGG
jgi:hypothetical protein